MTISANDLRAAFDLVETFAWRRERATGCTSTARPSVEGYGLPIGALREFAGYYVKVGTIPGLDEDQKAMMNAIIQQTVAIGIVAAGRDQS